MSTICNTARVLLDLAIKGTPITPENIRKWIPSFQLGCCISRTSIEEMIKEIHNGAKISTKGIKFQSMRLNGSIDLDGLEIKVPLTFLDTQFLGDFTIQNGKVSALELDGCEISGSINLTNSRIAGDLIVRKCIIHGRLLIDNAEVGSMLNLDATKLHSRCEWAVSAKGTRIGGYALLRDGFESKGGLNFFGARLSNTLDLTSAQLKTDQSIALDLGESDIRGSVQLRAPNQKTKMSCRTPFKADGAVNFVGTRIGGSIFCTGGHFSAREEISINLTRAEVGGGVYFDINFCSEGLIRLVSANIKGSLECDGGKFDPKSAEAAVDASSIRIGGNYFMRRGFTSHGQIIISNAVVGGLVSISDATIVGQNDRSITANSMTVAGRLLLINSSVTGTFSIVGTKIGGSIEAENCLLEARRVALNADGVKVDGFLHLRNGFRASGQVRLYGGKIGAGLDCQNARFWAKRGDIAIEATLVAVGGDIKMRAGFCSEGQIRLVNASVSGDIDFGGCYIKIENGLAIRAQRAVVKGNVFFNQEAQIYGSIAFEDASIGGNLEFKNAFLPDNSSSLYLSGVKVSRQFIWKNMSPECDVDLHHARAAQLQDDASWPLEGRLVLDGFEYEGFGRGAASDSKSRLTWLASQSSDNFYPQPHEQLIRVMRKMGKERDAREVAIDKQESLRKSGQLPKPAFLWNLFIGNLIGHGYKPGRALIVALFIIAFDALIYSSAFYSGYFILTKNVTVKEQTLDWRKLQYFDYKKLFDLASRPDSIFVSPLSPPFSSIIYSVENFVPAINLQQKSNWMIDTSTSIGLTIWYIACFQTVSGWLITVLLLAAWSGVLKKD